MKTSIYFIFLLFCGLCTSCRSGDSSSCLQSDGNILEQNRVLASFHSVANYTPANVYITQSNVNPYSVHLVGSMNILNAIRTTIIDGKLRIEQTGCIQNAHQLDIHINMPNILGIEVFGAGKIHGENAWFTNALILTTKGAGGIDVDVDATHITATIEGSGGIKLYGNSPTIDMESNGSGDFNSYGMYCQTVEAYLTASGDARVVASERLKGSIKGSGDLLYRGYPVLEVSDNGSGNVKNDN